MKTTTNPTQDVAGSTLSALRKTRSTGEYSAPAHLRAMEGKPTAQSEPANGLVVLFLETHPEMARVAPDTAAGPSTTARDWAMLASATNQVVEAEGGRANAAAAQSKLEATAQQLVGPRSARRFGAFLAQVFAGPDPIARHVMLQSPTPLSAAQIEREHALAAKVQASPEFAGQFAGLMADYAAIRATKEGDIGPAVDRFAQGTASLDEQSVQRGLVALERKLGVMMPSLAPTGDLAPAVRDRIAAALASVGRSTAPGASAATPDLG